MQDLTFYCHLKVVIHSRNKKLWKAKLSRNIAVTIAEVSLNIKYICFLLFFGICINT